MNPGKLRQWIVSRYLSQLSKGNHYSILILGPPGIGKSTAVREASMEIASKLGLEFIEYSEDDLEGILAQPQRYFVFHDLRLTQLEPSDLQGIPCHRNGYTVFSPLGWAKALSACPGILFLDELTNVQREDLLAAAYALVLDRRAGHLHLNDKTMVIAAGNTPDQSSIAGMLPAPLVNRFRIINLNPPTIEEWADWMHANFGEEWNKRALAYLKRFPQDLIKLPEAQETLENFPTPRTWTEVARWFEQDAEILRGLLGSEVGSKYSAFLRTSIPEIQELIRNPELFRRLSLDAQYLATVELSSWIERNQGQLDRALGLVQVMMDVSNEYAVLLVMCIQDPRLKYRLAKLIPDLRSNLIRLAKLVAVQE